MNPCKTSTEQLKAFDILTRTSALGYAFLFVLNESL